MAYFLGCDVSKRKLDLCLVDDHGVQVWTDQAENAQDDIAKLLLTVAGVYPELTCVAEATGCYHLAFAGTAFALGIPCLVYNPLLTKQQIRATVRGKKSDRTDSLLIARLGLRGEGRLYAPELYPNTKYYARGQERLGQLAVALHAYQSHVEQLLGDELSPEAQVSLEESRQAFLRTKRRFCQEMVASAPPELSRRLQSIPGVGPFIAASLIGEIQDMQRFRTSKQLIAYVGLDPKIRQSGHTLNSTGRLTKRGSAYLRRSLFIAANVAKRSDANFRAVYDKKRAEGKSYTVAVCVVARKLLTVTRAIWLNETTYDGSRFS